MLVSIKTIKLFINLICESIVSDVVHCVLSPTNCRRAVRMSRKCKKIHKL